MKVRQLTDQAAGFAISLLVQALGPKRARECWRALGENDDVWAVYAKRPGFDFVRCNRCSQLTVTDPCEWCGERVSDVVRCGACVYFKENAYGSGHCTHWKQLVTPDNPGNHVEDEPVNGCKAFIRAHETAEERAACGCPACKGEGDG